MKVLLVLIPFLMSSIAYSQSWGTRAGNAFTALKGDKETVEVVDHETLVERESTWNVDMEGLAYIMPDQPVSDQVISMFTGFGTTYKFSDKLHIVGKWIQFDLSGPQKTIWHHDHKLIGAGARGFFAKNQQWVVNIMSGTSSVEEENLGEVKNLEAPFFLDIKYFWMFGNNLMIGPQVTFGRVANACEDVNGRYLECGHGGYTAMSVSVQFGLPENWGN